MALDADTVADVARAAFMAGLLAETKKTATKAGRKTVQTTVKTGKKVTRKASAYSKKYGRAVKQVQSKYKTKAGQWKKDGFKRAQKAAHKLARSMR